MFSVFSLGSGPAAGSYYEREASFSADEYYGRSDPNRGLETTLLGSSTGRWRTISKLGDAEKTGEFPDGNIDTKAEFRNALAGLSKDGKKALVRGAGEAHNAGFDVTYSPPKSVSVLRELARQNGDDRTEKLIDEILEQVQDEAFKWGLDTGAFVIRTREGNGVKFEAAQEIVTARFRHGTTRPDKLGNVAPQHHTHNVVFNMARRPDGEWGALHQPTFFRWRMAMGSFADARLAALLRERLGWEVEPTADSKSWQVAGAPADLAEEWSYRKKDIDARAAEHGRRRTKVDVLATRGRKTDVPDAESLDAIWRADVTRLDLTPEKIFQNVANRSAQLEEQRKEGAAEVGDRAAPAWAEAVQAALDDLEDKSQTFTKAQLYKSVAERTAATDLWDQGLEEGQARIDAELASRLRPLQAKPGQPERLTTWRNLGREKDIIRAARARRAEPPKVSAEAVAAALAEYPTITAEQAAAVRSACGSGGTVVVQGDAGTGKSFSTRVSVAAHRAEGVEVLGLAPSHKARSVLAADAGLEGDETLTTQKVLHAWRTKGENLLPRGGFVVVDEAGMLGTRDTRDLLHMAWERDTKLILQGDRKQLAPVEAGRPFELLQDELGAAGLRGIRRQKDPRHVELSKLLANGKGDLAMERYDQLGSIAWSKDRDAGMAALVGDYSRHLDEKPGQSRTVIANRRADVDELNERLREVHAERGLIDTEKQVEVATLSKKGELRGLALAKGDRVTFGETVKVKGADGTEKVLLNGDQSVITAVEVDQAGETLLSFEVGKGDAVERFDRVRVNDLVGYRPEGGKTPALPKLDRGWATTSHGSQGDSLDQVFVYAGDGMDRRSSYVNLTRHKRDVRVYVSVDDATDRVWEGRDRDTKRSDITMEEVKAHVFRTAVRSETPGNAMDYLTTGARDQVLQDPGRFEREMLARETSRAAESRRFGERLKEWLAARDGKAPAPTEAQPGALRQAPDPMVARPGRAERQRIMVDALETLSRAAGAGIQAGGQIARRRAAAEERVAAAAEAKAQSSGRGFARFMTSSDEPTLEAMPDLKEKDEAKPKVDDPEKEARLERVAAMTPGERAAAAMDAVAQNDGWRLRAAAGKLAQAQEAWVGAKGGAAAEPPKKAEPVEQAEQVVAAQPAHQPQPQAAPRPARPAPKPRGGADRLIAAAGAAKREGAGPTRAAATKPAPSGPRPGR